MPFWNLAVLQAVLLAVETPCMIPLGSTADHNLLSVLHCISPQFFISAINFYEISVVLSLCHTKGLRLAVFLVTLMLRPVQNVAVLQAVLLAGRIHGIVLWVWVLKLQLPVWYVPAPRQQAISALSSNLCMDHTAQSTMWRKGKLPTGDMHSICSNAAQWERREKSGAFHRTARSYT